MLWCKGVFTYTTTTFRTDDVPAADLVLASRIRPYPSPKHIDIYVRYVMASTVLENAPANDNLVADTEHMILSLRKQIHDAYAPFQSLEVPLFARNIPLPLCVIHA